MNGGYQLLDLTKYNKENAVGLLERLKRIIEHGKRIVVKLNPKRVKGGEGSETVIDANYTELPVLNIGIETDSETEEITAYNLYTGFNKIKCYVYSGKETITISEYINNEKEIEDAEDLTANSLLYGLADSGITSWKQPE